MFSRGGPPPRSTLALLAGPLRPAPLLSLYRYSLFVFGFSLSFSTQRLNRIEPRGTDGRIESEEQADQGSDADAQRNRPELNGCWNRGEPGNANRDQCAQNR